MNVQEGFWKFHDMHKGETGLIVANGPSLEQVPIEFLKSYITLGCNRITGMAPEFVPNYYACTGITQIVKREQRETMYPMLAHPDCKAAFINRMYAHLFPFENIYTILSGAYYGIENTRFFSYDPLNIIGIGATMTFILLEIAFYMGFDPVLIVGLDHHYPKGTKKHFYDDSEFPLFETAPGPIYNYDSATWQEQATIMLDMASEAYKEHGRTIINIGRDSQCTSFRKEALSAWVQRNNSVPYM